MAAAFEHLLHSLQEKVSKLEGHRTPTPRQKIFVLGAGYIGTAVVDALCRAGHDVSVLIQKESSASMVAKLEARPLVGRVQELDKFKDALDECDTIIDTVQDPSDHATVSKVLEATVASAKRTASKRKRLIMTSGVLVYKGPDRDKLWTENDSGDNPMLQGRVAAEKAVLGAKEIDGLVLRPAFVYGGTMGRFHQAHWITGAFDAQGNSVVKGDPLRKFGWVHIHDLAEAYLRLVEAPASVVAHQIYNVADDTNVSMKDLIEAGRKLSSPKPATAIIYQPASSEFFDQAMETSCLTSHHKMTSHVGWIPRHGDMMKNLAIYGASYRAHSKPEKHTEGHEAAKEEQRNAEPPKEQPKPAVEPVKEQSKPENSPETKASKKKGKK